MYTIYAEHHNDRLSEERFETWDLDEALEEFEKEKQKFFMVHWKSITLFDGNTPLIIYTEEDDDEKE